MTRTAFRLAVARSRTHVGQTLALAALMVVATWLPTLLGADLIVGAMLALVVVVAALIGTFALDERRVRVLDQAGATRSSQSLIAAVSIVPALVAAFVVSILFTLATAGAHGSVRSLVFSYLVVLVGAYVATWLLPLQHSVTPSGKARRRWRVVVTVVLVFLGLLLPPYGLALIAARLTSGAWSTGLRQRTLGRVLAIAVAVFSVVFIAASSTWSDLSFAFLVLLPGLAVSLWVLSTDVLTIVLGLVGRSSGRAHLALAAFSGRRRLVAPLAGLVALTMAIAVTNAVVAASFGQRERAYRATHPTIVHRAGTADDQLLVPVPPVDRAALQTAADRVVAGTNARAVIVESVGTGDTSNVPLLSTSEPLSVHLERSKPASPSWVGVVDPADLSLLGWQDAAAPLNNGSVVLTGENSTSAGGTVRLATPNGPVVRPAVTMPGDRVAARLPGALVSRVEAQRLSPLVITALVVVTPEPGAHGTLSGEHLETLGRTIQAEARTLPTVKPSGLTPAARNDFDVYAAVLSSSSVNGVELGSGSVSVAQGGPLDDVPLFSGGTEAARRSMPALASIPIIVALAAVFLALGATRRDDEVLETQGALIGLRTSIAAIRAASITLGGALVAAAAGIGIPAVAFWLYRPDANQPDVPLVVPELAGLVLVGVPLLTTAIAVFIWLIDAWRRGGAAMADLELVG